MANPDLDQSTRMLPADLDAERATLGSLLMDAAAIRLVASLLDPDAFYLEKHAWVYEAIHACAQAHVPPDIRTVSDTLRRAGRLDAIGGLPYLVDLTSATPTAVYVEHYARIVARTAALRRLIQTGGKIAALGYNEQDDPADVLDQAHLLLEKCRYRRAAAPVHGYTAPELLALTPTPTRWIIEGLISAGFGYLAAKPGMGKTWILLAWAIAVASGGKVLGTYPVERGRVLFLALEDTEASLIERMRILLNGAPPPPLLHCYTEDSGWLPLDAGGVEQIEEHLERHRDIVLVVIDTLTAVAPDTGQQKGNPYRTEYRAYMPIRHLANRHNIAIIGSWHFNKAGAIDPMEMISGSMGLPAVSVNRLGIVRERSENDATLYSFSKRGRQQDLALEYDPVTCQWIYKGSATDYQASAARREILDALEDEDDGLTPAQLSRLLNKHYPSTKSLLKRMADDGQVYTIGKGKYKVRPRGGAEPMVSNPVEIMQIMEPSTAMIRESDSRAASEGQKTTTDHGDHGDHGVLSQQHLLTPHDLHDLHDLRPGLAHQNGNGTDHGSRASHDPHDPSHDPPAASGALAVLAKVDLAYIRKALARGADADRQLIVTHCTMRRVSVDAVYAALDWLAQQERETP